MCPYPFFEVKPPGAAPGPPVKTGARVRRFRGYNKCHWTTGPSSAAVHHPTPLRQSERQAPPHELRRQLALHSTARRRPWPHSCVGRICGPGELARADARHGQNAQPGVTLGNPRAGKGKGRSPFIPPLEITPQDFVSRAEAVGDAYYGAYAIGCGKPSPCRLAWLCWRAKAPVIYKSLPQAPKETSTAAAVARRPSRAG